MSTTPTEPAFMCAPCGELYDTSLEASLCCAPEAITKYECSRCGNDTHITSANAQLCCYKPEVVETQMCMNCLKRVQDCACA